MAAVDSRWTIVYKFKFLIQENTKNIFLHKKNFLNLENNFTAVVG